MTDFDQEITVVDFQDRDYTRYARHFAGCLVLTKDEQLLLQKRGDNWDRFPGMLATFGGQVDSGETADQGLARELHEELGATVNLPDEIYLGAITKSGLPNALIHGYFWHDKEGTITGCYEGEPAFFSCAADIFKQSNITSDAYWIVKQCISRRLID